MAKKLTKKTGNSKTKAIHEIAKEINIDVYEFVDFLAQNGVDVTLNTKVTNGTITVIDGLAKRFCSDQNETMNQIKEKYSPKVLGIYYNPITRKYNIFETVIPIESIKDSEHLVECGSIYGAKRELDKQMIMRRIIQPHETEGEECELNEIREIFGDLK